MSGRPKRIDPEMAEAWEKRFRNPQSTKPEGTFFPLDDRPIVTRKRKDGQYDVLRQDSRYVEGGKRIKTVGTSGDADFEKERWDHLTPRTDRNRRGRTTSTFYGFNVPEGGFK